MAEEGDISESHQAIGEFVIVFQWVESMYRKIGWFILDPKREEWPPMQLRKETTHALINKVTEQFIALTKKYKFPNGDEKSTEMRELCHRFHQLRVYRNRLLHSTYVELKSGGIVHGYLRSNPEIGVDPESGELIYDQEEFSSKLIHAKLRDYAGDMFQLNTIYMQLIHWHPFERHGTWN